MNFGTTRNTDDRKNGEIDISTLLNKKEGMNGLSGKKRVVQILQYADTYIHYTERCFNILNVAVVGLILFSNVYTHTFGVFLRK